MELHQDARLARHVVRGADLASDRRPPQDEFALAGTKQIGQVGVAARELLLREIFRRQTLRAQPAGEARQVQLLSGPHRPRRIDVHFSSTPCFRKICRATTSLWTSSGPS